MILRKFAKDNLEKVNWVRLSKNSNAIDLLEQNLVDKLIPK